MFSWIPIYTELAKNILRYRDRQTELIKMLGELKAAELPTVSIDDYGEHEAKIPLAVMDPFTFYACFNRRLTKENRRRILAHLKTAFNLQSEVPTDFDGIPIVDARRAWFFPYASSREADDIPSLWALAEAVVQHPPDKLNAKLF